MEMAPFRNTYIMKFSWINSNFFLSYISYFLGLVSKKYKNEKKDNKKS